MMMIRVGWDCRYHVTTVRGPPAFRGSLHAPVWIAYREYISDPPWHTLLSPVHLPAPEEAKDVVLMSSTTNIPQSNYQLIINALTNYADRTGIDLSANPFAEKLQLSNSPGWTGK